jgi:hypothetical protein
MINQLSNDEDLQLVEVIRAEININPLATSVVVSGAGNKLESINRVLVFYRSQGWQGQYFDGDTDIADESGAGYIEFKRI